MKVGDLVVFKHEALDSGIAVVVWVASNPSDSLSYKIGIVWHNGVEGEQYNWQMKVLATV
jgi:zinc transporter ZupT